MRDHRSAAPFTVGRALGLATVGRAVALAAIFGLFALVGCEQPPAEESEVGEPMQGMEGIEEDPGAESEEMQEGVTDLEEVNGSGVSGEAMAMHANDAVTIFLQVDGLPAEGEYQAHVHSGTCDEGGPVAVPLDPVLGLADGTGSSTTVLEEDELPAEDPHFVQVHGEGGAPVACGDMEREG